jgi:2-oxoglutarate dehydrogenase E2 component (dihydrolipoamide succinyltransferase)
MTELIEIELPKLGESILSAKVVQWLKKEGDFIEENEPLVEVTTDKVNSEIPSSCKGVLKKIVASIDQDIEIGQVLAIIETVQGDSSENLFSSEKNVCLHNSFLSPAVMRLAKENNLCLKDLEKIKGSGDQGRVTKQDAELFIGTKREKEPQICSENVATIQTVKMTHLRKAIAENMKKSFYEAPHATLITEVDLTNVLKKIETYKEEFFQKHGAKLTITSFIAKAIAAKKAIFLDIFINIIIKKY